MPRNIGKPSSTARIIDSGLTPVPSQILERLLRAGHDERVVEGALAVRTAPGDALVVVELEEQVELRAVEHVVVAHVEVEQRERDVGRAATGDGLDPSRGDRGGGRELLEHADRLVGRQHGHGGAEPDPSRRSGGGVDERGRRR
jgi:hypothetical protein